MTMVRCWSVVILALFVLGCGAPTPQEREKRRAVEAILTAITMKNPRLLEESASRARALHEAGQLTQEQFQRLEAIVNQARGGDWVAAEKTGYEFRARHPFVKEGQ